MKIDLIVAQPLKHSTPALVIGCWEDNRDDLFAQCDAALNGLLGRLAENREFSGKANSTHLVHTLGKLPAERLVLVGLGKKAELNDERIRQASGNAVQALRAARIASFSTALHLAGKETPAVEAVCEGTLLGSYAFEHYKTKDKEERFSYEAMTLLLKSDTVNQDRARVEQTEIICQAVQLARDLVSHPGNVATTGYLADTARELAERHPLKCSVLELDELEKLGMNALVAVGKGSHEPPRLIVLEYHGAGGKDRPVVLVGKGVTFDSGGISIKPGAGMEEMKTDMGGGAAVLATMQAAAGLKLPINLVGIIPTAENMPDGKAYKPGDVLTSMSGTTIEITNTDAEGRLILCDALHYAQKYRPAAMVDLATLTGACVVALGHLASGLMGNDQRLVDALKRAGERCGDRVWELPLWDGYGEAMKSDIADLKNAGSRDGGSITAGWFLKQFVGKTRWAHLDIAGTAWSDKAQPCCPKGATGVGVRLLIEYLRELTKGK
ncbi:leucyl aminopeptidase [Pelotalea chapellei]|uniref:Probable cytosol aminopeptidase n=1 Tax=Pelotalea chapellei TaxID=44671 RepID=A0ABS5UBR2_9BACT|nr:leucyl aminopeptidase [Pelotalea chapellei]MBT1073117.1 leucyl aminopeptidase [Pelotalea chapellei]